MSNNSTETNPVQKPARSPSGHKIAECIACSETKAIIAHGRCDSCRKAIDRGASVLAEHKAETALRLILIDAKGDLEKSLVRLRASAEEIEAVLKIMRHRWAHALGEGVDLVDGVDKPGPRVHKPERTNSAASLRERKQQPEEQPEKEEVA